MFKFKSLQTIAFWFLILSFNPLLTLCAITEFQDLLTVKLMIKTIILLE